MSRHLISSHVVLPVVRALRELGAHIPDLPSVGTDFDGAAADAMMDEAARQLGDAVGVESAARLPPGALGPVDYALSTSATVREGLRQLSRYYGVATERVELVVLDDAIAGFELVRRAGVAHSRHWIEFSVATIVLRLRAGVGERMAVEHVQFAHAAPSSSATHERIFDGPVVFDAPVDRAVLPRPILDQVLITSAPLLAEVLARRLDEMEMSRRDDPVIRRLRKEISRQLGDPTLCLDVIAKRLALSRRSLQRHLAGLETSFSEVVDDIRCMRARDMMEQKATPTEIAAELGFADASAFLRAFRRWTSSP